MYKKNVPYRLRVWMGYQDLSESYIAASTTTATLGSVILGTQVDVTLAGPMMLRAGLEGNVYSFGLGTLVGSDSAFLFRSYAGFRMNLDSNPLAPHLLEGVPTSPDSPITAPSRAHSGPAAEKERAPDAGSPSCRLHDESGAAYCTGFVASIFCCSRNRRTWMLPSRLSSASRRASLRCCRMPQIASSLMSRWVSMMALS